MDGVCAAWMQTANSQKFAQPVEPEDFDRSGHVKGVLVPAGMSPRTTVHVPSRSSSTSRASRSWRGSNAGGVGTPLVDSAGTQSGPFQVEV